MRDDELLNRALSRFSRDMLLLLDADSLAIVSASDELLKRLNYEREQLLGRCITELDSGLSAMVFWDEYRRGRERGVEAAESVFIDGDGNELPLSKDVSLFREQGRDWLLVRLTDDTRTRQEQQICARLAAQLRATLEAAGDGILVITADGRVGNMNRRMSAMWGMPEQVIEGGNDAIHGWIGDRLTEPSIYQHLIDNLGEEMDSDDFFVLELDNGKVFELRVFPQLSSGEIEGYVLNFHDVTQHVQYEQALILEREKAEQSSQYKSDFLSNMSHELRTPMNAILGFAQLMEMDEQLADSSRGYVDEILRAGHHLLDLINEVLDLSRVESGRMELDSETIDIDELLRQVLSLMRPLADARDIEMSYCLHQPLTIRSDRKRLRQVLINLLSNAIKYNRDAGSVVIEVTTAATGGVAIHVRDSGEGIPPERLADLFEPFNRLDADKTHIEGSGIGLMLTRRLIELMKGEIKVESVVGEGTTFSVFLPLDNKPAFRPRPIAAPDPVKNATVAVSEALPPMRILVVEDIVPNQLVARKLIEKMGHQVDVAANGQEALERVRQGRYQLVFMDMRMPGMDGLAATRAIRQLDGDYRRLPIIAMTANATGEDREACLDAGMNDFISKPINRVQLRDTLAAVAAGL